MRVIAGTYRSRQLQAPRGMATRPTSDRLRETLYNILASGTQGPRLEGCRFADLYAGSGAVGIEAISRGASYVWFAEKAAPALQAIRANLNALRITQGFAIEERGAGALLERLAKAAQKAEAGGPSSAPQLLDILYLDPPWEAEAEYAATLNLLGSTRGRVILAPGALVIGEHNTKSSLTLRFGSLAQTRTLRQGDAALTFYRQDAEQSGLVST